MICPFCNEPMLEEKHIDRQGRLVHGWRHPAGKCAKFGELHTAWKWEQMREEDNAGKCEQDKG